MLALARRHARGAAAVAAALVAGLILPVTAGAAWVPTPAADPDPNVVGVGGVAVAGDGNGAVVELKRDGSGTHVYVVELVAGVWGTPQRVDGGQDGTSSQPQVAVRSGGEIMVAWTNEGRLFAAVRPSSATAMGPPALVFNDPRSNGVVVNPALALSVNGAAYLAFTTAAAAPGAPAGPLAGLLSPGSPSGDPSVTSTSSGAVRLARFDRTSWSVVAAPMNIDAGHDAGRGAARPAVFAGADGTALVSWGEAVGSASQVFLRRVNRATPSAFPQQASVGSLEGHAGEDADSPSVALAFDASYGWAVLRQSFDDGGSAHSRVIARRLVGDELVGGPVAVDGLAFGSADAAIAPALALDGRGRGFAVAGTQAAHAVVGAHLNDASVFGPGMRVDSTANATAPTPTVAGGEFDSQLIGWFDNAGVHARVAVRGVLGPEAQVAPGPADPAAGLSSGMDRYGDAALAFVQGAGPARQLTGALYAQPPSAPRLRQVVVASRNGRPGFAWGPSFAEWGGPAYAVVAGSRVVGRTRGLSLTAATRFPQGVYPFRVLALDRYGQATPSVLGKLLVDSVAPRLSVRVGGARSAGGTVVLSLHVSDRSPSSGLRPTTVVWGDGTRSTGRRRATHVYARPGHYTVRVLARDAAGNGRATSLALSIG